MQKTIVTIKVIIAIAIMGFTGCGAGFDDDSGDQNPTVPWKGTAQLGSAARDWAYAVAADSSGNIYVTGNTEGDFDGNTNGGSFDCFLVKYNAAGEKEWSRQFGASLDETAFGVATDSKGNIYVTGCTGDSLDLDVSANNGSRDIFLVKFTPAGVREWSEYLGAAGNDQGLAVTVDCIDNIYVTGRTTSTLPGSDTAYSGGTGYDIFLAQYNSLGGCNKVTQAGTTSDDQGWGIAADSAGNVYITGYAEGGLLANSLIGGSDIVLLKYDANVTLVWSTQIGTSNDEIAYSVSIDSLGNNYITGSSRGDLGGSKDVFLVKHNSDGVFQWTRQWGTNEDEDSLATVVDSSDNIYVSGHSAGDLDGYANLGSSDLFLTKYSASGVFQWTSHMGTAAQDRIYGMAVNNTDEIFITGQTYGDLDGNTNAGNDDMILAKFNSSGELQ